MIPQAQAVSDPQLASEVEQPPSRSGGRLAWSIRRELWENRSLVAAPLAVALFVIVGFMISTIGMPQRRRAVMELPPAEQRERIERPYDFAAIAMFLTTLLVGSFYSVDSLQGERKDRSILFWKSLPVSDRTVVLSKAAVPLLVLPAIAFAVTLATQFVMLLWSTVVLLPSGLAATTWTQVPWMADSLFVAYGLIVMALWHAPIHAWLILVSAWARRAPLLWAILPAMAAVIVERIAFGTGIVRFAIRYRVIGGFGEAFRFGDRGTITSVSQLTPARFLTSPNLWVGLAFAAVFLAGAVRLRRDRTGGD